MWRFVFPTLVLGALFLIVPSLIDDAPATSDDHRGAAGAAERLDVDALRARSKNRALLLATDAELASLRHATLENLYADLAGGSERKRRLAGSLLGVSGQAEAIARLIHAFEAESEPRTLSTLAMALAESRTNAAIAALIRAIRTRPGLAAYEACRALRRYYGLSLGVDAEAWERWYLTTRATRD